eukprot:m.15278 g.15278  ORF g.15278 m.15278 type:complete len:381 (+) comp9637_c0_seq2:28-1170(+)
MKTFAISVVFCLISAAAGVDALPFVTVYQSGEDGFGCVRFPNLLKVNSTIYLIAERYNVSGDHCNDTLDGRPFVRNPHNYGTIALKSSHDGGNTWTSAQELPLEPNAWARCQGSVYIPERSLICVHYDAGPVRTSQNLIGHIHQQCYSLLDKTWSNPVNISAQLGDHCGGLLGSRSNGVIVRRNGHPPRILMGTWQIAKPNYVCVIASDDFGDSWRTLTMISNSSEAAYAVTNSQGDIYYNARHNQQYHCSACPRVTGFSTDGGDSFEVRYNDSASPLDHLDATPASLLSWHSTTTNLFLALPLGPGRSNLTIWSSNDGGRNWSSKGSTIGPSAYGGYSSMFTLNATHFGVAYESDSPPGTSKCSGACAIRFSAVEGGSV